MAKIDLNLLARTAHNPSIFSLKRSQGVDAEPITDFCVPCNPYFPTPEMFEDIRNNLVEILKFYPSDNISLVRELASVLGLDPATMVLANGSTELITWIDRLLVHSSLATPVPTFGRWTDQPRETGKQVHLFKVGVEANFRLDLSGFVRFIADSGARTAVVCNPNNPSGDYRRKSELLAMLQALEHLDLVVVDESFIDFVDAEVAPSLAQDVTRFKNVIVLKSLGKNFGLHGIRFGYCVANPDLAATLRDALPHWNINSIAEAIIFALKRNWAAYRRSLPRIHNDRAYMTAALEQIAGLTVYPSQGNFVLVRLPQTLNAAHCRDILLTEHNVFVRDCANKIGMGEGFLRLVCRPRAELRPLLKGLSAILGTVP